MSSVFGTRKVLEEIQASRREMHDEIRALIGEIRDMRLEFTEELRATRLEHRQLIEEYRQFTRDCVTRMERAAARQEKHLDDLLDESRAQRQALLRMIDRLGPAPGTA